MNFLQWTVAVLLSAIAIPTLAGDFPMFRGPGGNGIVDEKNVPTKWTTTENIAWKAELPGPGFGSPIVSKGHIFVTCDTGEGKNKDRTLLCFDRKSGEQLWTKSVPGDGEERTYGSYPHSSTTPLSDGDRVIVWHGSPGLYCYDFQGKELWKNDLGQFRHMWGYASSPIFHEDKIILFCGPGEGTFMAAIDKYNGKVMWKTNEPGGVNDNKPGMVGSFSTPIIVKVKGRDQILCSMPTRAVAYDPIDGKILWSVDGLPSPRGKLVYTSPVANDGIGLAFGGYNGPRIGFRLGGSGNVTDTNRLWHLEAKQPQRISSGVIVGNHVYVANDRPATIECIELDTGKVVWQARTGGTGCWGSVVSADGNLYVTDQDGTTHVFRPSPEKYEVIATNKLGEPSNGTPAISDGQIFIRTSKSLFAIGK